MSCLCSTVPLEGFSPFPCSSCAVARKETSAPSGAHRALLICTEELVSKVLKMPGLNNPYVSVSCQPIEMGIRVEGRCQAGGQGQAAVQ